MEYEKNLLRIRKYEKSLKPKYYQKNKKKDN